MALIIFFQILTTLVLLKLTWWAYKKFDLKISIHNLPIILMCGLLILAGALLAYKSLYIYLPVGILLGLFIWTLNSIEVNQKRKISFIHKLLVSLVVSFIWPQMIVFMIFYGINYEKLDVDEEL